LQGTISPTAHQPRFELARKNLPVPTPVLGVLAAGLIQGPLQPSFRF
jgi:hypothetical protein